MKNKTREWICLVLIVIACALITWFVATVAFTGSAWVYNHAYETCLIAGVAFVFTMIGIVLMWNYDKPTTKALAATAIIAATAATANAGDKNKSSGVTTGLTNPTGNSTVERPTWPLGWLFHGWDFGWGFWRDGLDSWQSGHPVITIDPEPPSNSDTCGK